MQRLVLPPPLLHSRIVQWCHSVAECHDICRHEVCSGIVQNKWKFVGFKRKYDICALRLSSNVEGRPKCEWAEYDLLNIIEHLSDAHKSHYI